MGHSKIFSEKWHTLLLTDLVFSVKQCDQIERLLKVLCETFSSKSSSHGCGKIRTQNFILNVNSKRLRLWAISDPVANVINKFKYYHRIVVLCWNKAIWLVKIVVTCNIQSVFQQSITILCHNLFTTLAPGVDGFRKSFFTFFYQSVLND